MTTVEPSTAVSDPELVFLSIQSPNIREPILLLRIPHAAFPQYSTKPRKWLQYTGFALTGKQGILFLVPPPDPELAEEQEPHVCDVELGVEAGDRFIYRLDEEPATFDWCLRYPGGSRQASLASNSTTANGVRDNAKAAYGRCPFSNSQEGICDTCHLIPRNRGDFYMKDLYRLRGDVHRAIEIDDPKIVLWLNTSIHRGLDSKEVAFLKTPNYALKSNEVVLNRPDGKNAEAYRVTVHCFSANEDDLPNVYHGMSSDLLVDRRPEDFIFDFVYACNLFSRWGVGPIDFVKNERKRLFSDGELKRGEDPAGEKAKQDAKDKKRANDESRNERQGRRRVPAGTRDDSERPIDAWDSVMILSLWANNTSITEMEAHDRAVKEEERQRKMRETEAWVQGAVSDAGAGVVIASSAESESEPDAAENEI